MNRGGRSRASPNGSYLARNLFRTPDFSNNVLPSTFKNSGKLLHDFNRDVGFAMLDLLDVAFAEIGEVGKLGLGHLDPHPQAVNILADDLAPFHGLQLARITTS